MVDLDEVSPDGFRKLSRVEYERMVELGMFADEHLELLDGMLVTMNPQGGPHAGVSAWFHQRLVSALYPSFEVRGHSPFAASDVSEPEPDISVSRLSEDRFVHPVSALLLIEVSESSLRKDRLVKTRIYAAAGVPEYWIVNLSSAELTVEVYTEPSAEGYRRMTTLRDGDILRPSELPSVEIAIAEIPRPSR